MRHNSMYEQYVENQPTFRKNMSLPSLRLKSKPSMKQAAIVDFKRTIRHYIEPFRIRAIAVLDMARTCCS
jgi:hypothetical protein